MYYNLNSVVYENELIQIILDTFGEVTEEDDPNVRQAVCELIIEVCNNCDSNYHVKLLQILDKVSFYLICYYTLGY